MFERLFSLERRRRRLLNKTPPGPLRDYLAVPFPDGDSDWRQLAYLALDLETTGLDPHHDAVLTFGYVLLNREVVDLGSARHRLVRVSRQIPERSAVIHQITDDRAATGEPLEVVLGDLLTLLAGRVLVVHHAKVELGFLRRACERLYGGRLLVPTVDTQWLARRRLERQDRAYKGRELRLFNLREQYNLPRYKAHDALSDALATAELFIAQTVERAGDSRLTLKEILLPQ